MQAKIWIQDGYADACMVVMSGEELPADVFRQDSEGNITPVPSPWKDDTAEMPE